MRRIVSRAVIIALSLLAFPITSIGTGVHPTASAAPTQLVGRASALTDFNTTLFGPASDGKHTVSINVDWSTVLASQVDVRITIGKGTSLQSGVSGSTYTFTLPASDFHLGAGTASLDTQKDLGAFGHITAQWTFVTKNESNAVNCFGTSSSQHLIASGSADFKLSFPCAGSLSGKIAGTNIDSAAVTPTGSGNVNRSSFNGLSSIYFSGASASQSSKGLDLSVGAFSFGGQSNFLYVTVGAGNSANANQVAGNGLTTSKFGLTNYSHFASDKLASGAFTSTPGSASLNYRGALGTAQITWKGKGSPFSLTMQGQCLSSSLTGAQATTTVVLASQEASLSGSAKVTACLSDKAGFRSTDTGTLINTHKGTTPAAGAGSGPGAGAGPSISSGSFAVSSATPTDGATGVSTSAAISVTFNAAPGKVAQIILTEANNPTGIVMLPPPTVSGNTITSTPPTPLKPNTQYKETVVAQGAAGGFVSYTATFTTGS